MKNHTLSPSGVSGVHVLASYLHEGGHFADQVVREPAFQPLLTQLEGWQRRVHHPDPLVACELDLALAPLNDLLLLTPEARRCALRLPEYQSWGLVIRLLEEAREHRFGETKVTLELTEAAVELATYLSTDFYGQQEVRNLKALTKAHLANAHRLQGNLDQAQHLMNVVREDLDERTPPRIVAEVYLLEGSLHATMFDDEKQLRTMELASRQLIHITDVDFLLRAYISIADGYFQGGEFMVAAGYLEAVLPHLEGQPRLQRVVLHNLLSAAERLRDPEILRQTLALDCLPPQPGDLYLRLRLLTASAVLAELKGNLLKARRLLEQASQLMIQHRLVFQAVVVHLDLCRLWLRVGQPERARRTAASLVDLTTVTPRTPAERLTSENKLALIHLAKLPLRREATIWDLREHLHGAPHVPWLPDAATMPCERPKSLELSDSPYTLCDEPTSNSIPSIKSSSTHCALTGAPP